MGNNTDGELGKIVATAAAIITEADCVALVNKNTASTKKMDTLFETQKTQSTGGTVTIEKVITKRKTVSSVKVNGADCAFRGKSISGASCSSNIRDYGKNAISHTKTLKGVIEEWEDFVLAPKERDFEKGLDLCDKQKNYKPHPDKGAKSQTGHGCHAEAGILASLGKAGCLGPGTSLTFKINWPKKGSESMPCPHCLNMMCAVKECGVTIEVCSASNKPVPLEDNDCPKEPKASDKNYIRFQNKVMDKVSRTNEGF